ncbi:MAG: hypothetical protein A3C47_03135 [Omnitrophica bacterium RIFCSPHIGHO2_02_FULL_51_18]|nr:MAG: hypothetical protein A3C47_03135 [Omnitrophica bacterium RIFCSPHIGHO2_02_FULL_51_18]
MQSQTGNKIISFKDLIIYQNTYKASVEVMLKIVPSLPDSERFDLKDQLSRSCKAVPRLIAEGYAKRHQRLGFQKYLDDALGECNELIVSLSHAKDVYHKQVDTDFCDKMIELYEISGKQIYKLSESWSKIKGVKGIRS